MRAWILIVLFALLLLFGVSRMFPGASSTLVKSDYARALNSSRIIQMALSEYKAQHSNSEPSLKDLITAGVLPKAEIDFLKNMKGLFILHQRDGMSGNDTLIEGILPNAYLHFTIGGDGQITQWRFISQTNQ